MVNVKFESMGSYGYLIYSEYPDDYALLSAMCDWCDNRFGEDRCFTKHRAVGDCLIDGFDFRADNETTNEFFTAFDNIFEGYRHKAQG